MKVKMAFGAVLCALLAFAVLRFFGMFQGAVTLPGIAGGILLSGLYFMAFRAALVGKEGPVVVTRERIMQWQEEERARIKREEYTTVAA